MIKNIVFDIGKVLVDFKWEEIFREVGGTDEEVKVFGENFINGIWNELDRGVMDEEDVIKLIQEKNPEIADKVSLFWDRIIDTIESYSYSRPLIQELKDRGFKVYLLTNYPRSLFISSVEQKFDFYDLVDGEVVSARVKHTKPEKEIYEILFDKYSLIPEECVFMDDKLANVETANLLGMNAFVFTNFEEAKAKLEDIISKRG